MENATPQNATPQHPELLALSFIAPPLAFFALITLLGPALSFATYPFLAWSLTGLCAAFFFLADKDLQNSLTIPEQLAVLAGHALLALLMSGVALMVMPLAMA